MRTMKWMSASVLAIFLLTASTAVAQDNGKGHGKGHDKHGDDDDQGDDSNAERGQTKKRGNVAERPLFRGGHRWGVLRGLVGDVCGNDHKFRLARVLGK
jgi:hypothetical protein